MLRNLTLSASVATMILAAPLLAAEQSTQRISDALCGRASEESVRAEALDKTDGTHIPEVWLKSKPSDLEKWLHAPACSIATEQEQQKYARRRNALEMLRQRVRLTVDERASDLTPVPRWRPAQPLWPTDQECAGCSQLRHAATVVDGVATQWPKDEGDDAPIGKTIENARRRASLIREVCGAIPLPPAGPWNEIERRFKYYTWTVDGVQLLKVAKWLEQLHSLGKCLDQ